MQTERVTFLTTPDHKAALDAFARDSGTSVGHVVREATSQFMSQPTAAEEAELRALVDRMVATLDKTHRETDAFLKAMGVR